MLTQIQKLQIQTTHLLFSMFQDQPSYSIMNYDSVDKFYSHIGYDLESEPLLHSLNVHSTSALMSLFSDYNAYLEGDLSEEKFIASKYFELSREPLISVPSCVGQEIEYRRTGSTSSGTNRSNGIILKEVFKDLNTKEQTRRSINDKGFQSSEFYNWMQSSKNYPIFVKALTEGFTIDD